MSLRTPPLHARHDDRGAKFTEFGGWDMPVEFTSIREEHASVREHAGSFDVSHMGQIFVSGPDAVALTNRLTTNDVNTLSPGDAQYAAITDEDGVMLDDVVVYCLPESDEHDLLFVPNAGHDEQMVTRWERFRDQWELDATIENATADYGMVAVQGPDAPGIVADRAEPTGSPENTDGSVLDLSKFQATYADVEGVECWVARTGYTGEDGFELVFPADQAEAVWDSIVEDAEPCGLGARDTLRMEMGFLLSGQDFHPEDEPRTPYEARIGFTVKLDTKFVGHDALERQKADGVDQQFVGIVLEERGVPRHGYDLEMPDGEHVGHLTSGTMSPTLDEPIGLGYLDVEHAESGTELNVVIRDRPKTATVTYPPFLEDQ